MRSINSSLIVLVAGALCMPVALGQAPASAELRQEATQYNSQFRAGVPISTVIGDPPGSDGRAPTQAEQEQDDLTLLPPTPNQFQGLVSFGGLAVTSNRENLDDSRSFVGNAENLQLPRSPAQGKPVVVLKSARVAAPFVAQRIAFLFGSIIPTPETDEDGTLLDPVAKVNYWLPEPYSDNDHAGAGYYWSPHRRAVFAVQPGPIDITWKKAEPSRTEPEDYSDSPGNYVVEAGYYYRLFKIRYYVSGSPVKPPRRIYWTEGVFRALGKAVSVPTARVGAVNVVYNSNFPERVESEYSAPGQSHITEENRLEERRTLWYDHMQHQILAYNKEGRVFIELLGDLNPDGQTRKFLGFEVVDVLKQPIPDDLEVDLGERLPAYQDGRDDSELSPEVLQQGPGQEFAYRYFVPGTDEVMFYATRETRNLNDLLVHWLEEGVEGLRWPFRFVRYRLVWPDEVERYSHYVRPLVATEAEARATAVPLPTSNVPFIAYQDPFDRPRAKLTEKFEFFTHLDSSVPVHRTLLRFVSGDHVRFERVFSWLDSNLRNGAFAGTIATNLTAWDPDAGALIWGNELLAPRVVTQTVDVGTRISAPAGEFAAGNGETHFAGYIRETEGTSFSATAYINPFTSGFEAANKGAIIPINAIPGKNLIEVWWFREKAGNPEQGFEPIYWPSFIGRYTLQWPSSPREIVMASNDGTGPLSSLEARGRIYYQNDPLQRGYNPNEEHALMLGGQAYALRDDLNYVTGENYSSDPFVLIEYTGADDRPAMSVFKVLREKPEEGILFDYIVEAGTLLQAPMPLPLLPKPVEGSGVSAKNYNTEPDAGDGDLPANWDSGLHGLGTFGHYDKFTYQDRKNEFWVYRGVHSGLPALKAGTYNTETSDFVSAGSGTAVAGEPFTYEFHVSRRAESLLLQPKEGVVLPAWLRISGMTVTGLPAEDDAGELDLEFVVTDTGDGAQTTVSLKLTVAEEGIVATQGPLLIPSTTLHGEEVVHVGRPPYLAESPVGTNSFAMRFYYRTQEGFAWPGVANPPPVDSIVPYLRAQGDTADPAAKLTPALDIVYRPVWPVQTPVLQLGDTLTTPKLGLPAVRGQSSLRIIYQQSIAENIAAPHVSVVLHDPTREKEYDISKQALTELPEGVRAQLYQGKYYFPNLPPHLARRLFFDPNRGSAGHLVFRGEFKDEPVGDKYLLLNVLRGPDLAAAKALCPEEDLKKAKWDAAIDGLATLVETFHENPSVPGQYIPNDSLDRTVGVGALTEITSDDTAVDSYALSATGPGSGYVSFIVGNGRAFTPVGDPVSVYVIRVGGPLYAGELKLIPSDNPLSELLTLQHSADLAGRFDEFEYEWMIAPPVDGFPPVIDETMSGWTKLADGLGLPIYTLGGSGIQVLIDNYITLRYRPRTEGHPLQDQWSAWTVPQLAEGWIKRVLAGINPFNQRVGDLFNNRVNTEVSLITQAGGRWEGDIALNLESIDDHGLIEIYETVLRRGRMLSIGAGINFGPANDALLLAAGYLNDLYLMLGNEAWADAANPTIGIGTKDKTYGDIATALFAFKGQMASLLEEELALLRGRDDFLQPGVEVRPVYNRLYWNYTRGIDSGEIIYALNYNIQENADDGVDGVVNAADAQRMFPQGHGDAYGHYLTGLKGYYSLMLDTDFDWVPRTEAVLVLGKPVQVDYQDERKFAAAATAVARTGRQVFDLTWRRDYKPGEGTGWQHFEERRVNDRRAIDSTRYWSMDHWANRTAQGAYFNWVVGNAILPEVDPDPTHEGIQKVDRTSVPELKELSALNDDLLAAFDSAENGLTPMGLPEASVAFDLDPELVVGANGERTSHFEQIYDRARAALGNALVAFDEAKDVTRLLRSEEDSLAEFQAAVAQQEFAFTNALISIYGTPYSEDIGPGKTYRTGYYGPDLIHYMYVDTPELSFKGLLEPAEAGEYKIDIQNFPDNWSYGDSTAFNFALPADSPFYTEGVHYVSFHLPSHGFFGKPGEWASARQSPGEIQQAISDLIKSHAALRRALDDAAGAKGDLDAAVRLFKAKQETYDDIRDFERGKLIADQVVQASTLALTIMEAHKEAQEDLATDLKNAFKESMPKSFIAGMAAGGDLTAAARAAAEMTEATTKAAYDAAAVALTAITESLAFATQTESQWIDFSGIAPLEWDQELREAVIELAGALGDVQGQLYAINESLQAVDDAKRNYQRLLAEGERLQLEREVARQRAAAIIQGFRTRDAAFRVFRNEKLERYKSLFDLAARYTFLAAQAYDYETGLLHTETGKSFVSRIIQSRALGVMKDGEPQYAGSNTGDPGLSSVLAEMYSDWSVLKRRLGFNNPDDYGTTVSLRTENLRILPGPDGDTAWRDVLQKARMTDLLQDEDVRTYCMQVAGNSALPVPGIVLEFQTVIADGVNLFGRPLAARDHAFSPSSFATKIYGMGIAFEGYKGMDDPESNSGAIHVAGGASPTDPDLSFLDPGALSATPYVYLIPAGVDSMRSPPLGDVSLVRSWNVDDVTIPLPFNIGASEFSTKKLYQSSDSLSEPMFSIRKHQAFRPVSSASVFTGELIPTQFTNSRLIGRSVWNSKWKLIIPGKTLLANPNEGLDRFIDMVKDIKLHFVTYSYAGN